MLQQIKTIEWKWKKKTKQKDGQIFGSGQGAEKTMERESDGDTNISWRTKNSLQRLRKETGGI